MDSHVGPHAIQLLQQRGDYGIPHAANHFAFRGVPFPHFHHPPFPIPPNVLFPPRSPILPLINQPPGAAGAHFIGNFIHQPPFHPPNHNHNPRSREMRRQRPSKRARQRMKKKMYVEENSGNRGESNRQASESGYETTGDCHTPKKVMPHGKSAKGEKSVPIWNKNKTGKGQPMDSTSEALEAVDEKTHWRSDSASSYNSLNVSDTSLKKLLKDLHRCSVSITRYQAMLTKNCDDGMENLLHLFNSLKKNFNDRETDMIKELNAIRESAGAILQRRKDTATYLRQAAEQSHTLEDVQVTELKQQIKKFVTDRKVDEEIGTIARFQADKDDLLPHIMGFGKVNNVRHLYTEWEENPAEMIEISKHRRFFPSVGKCSSSLSSNSQESICNEETAAGLDSAFVESPNTSIDAEEQVSSGDLDSSVNSSTKPPLSEKKTDHQTYNSSTSAAANTEMLTQTDPAKKNVESATHKDERAEKSPPPPPATRRQKNPTPPPPPPPPAPVPTTSSNRTVWGPSSSAMSSPVTVKHESSSKNEHQQPLPKSPKRSPMKSGLRSTVVVVVSSNKSPTSSKESKKSQSSNILAKKVKESEKKRVAPIVIEEIIEKKPGHSDSCDKDGQSQEMKEDPRKYSAAELREIQQRVRESLRQQGVYLYDPITGDGPPKPPPVTTTYQTRPEVTKESNETPLIRKKKTPTQLRRERKKRQKERERRQREMEKKVQSDSELSKQTTSETKEIEPKYPPHSTKAPFSDHKPTEEEEKRLDKSLDQNSANRKTSSTDEDFLEDKEEDQSLDSSESCLASSDSNPSLNSSSDHLSNTPTPQDEEVQDLVPMEQPVEDEPTDQNEPKVTEEPAVLEESDETSPDSHTAEDKELIIATNEEGIETIRPEEIPDISRNQEPTTTSNDSDTQCEIDMQTDHEMNTQPDTNDTQSENSADDAQLETEKQNDIKPSNSLSLEEQETEIAMPELENVQEPTDVAEQTETEVKVMETELQTDAEPDEVGTPDTSNSAPTFEDQMAKTEPPNEDKMANTEPPTFEDEMANAEPPTFEDEMANAEPPTFEDQTEEALTVQEERIPVTELTEESETGIEEESELPLVSQDEPSADELQEYNTPDSTGQTVPQSDATPLTTTPLATPSNPHEDTEVHFTNNDDTSDDLSDKLNAKELPECANGDDHATILTNTMETSIVAIANKEMSLESGSQDNTNPAGLRHEE